MMYQNKLVAAIKVNGKVLRENGDTVTVPFGSEYSVLIKNLNSVRVQIKVSVDGSDATEGAWLVVQPNSSIELERFIKNGNMASGNRFKFIERTGDIEKHRGIKAEDGLIRVEYKIEKRPAIQDEVVVRRHYYDYYIWPYHYPNYVWYSNSGPQGSSLQTSYTNCGNQQGSITAQAMNCNVTRCAAPNDSGITVPGSLSNQQFQATAWFPTHDQSEVLVLKLRGELGGKKITKPLTVKSKLTCSTCGKSHKSGADFCSKCGTALTII